LAQVIDALGLLLPSSPLYSILSVLPEPDATTPTSTTTAYVVQVAIHNSLPTLEEIVSLTEADEEEKIDKEVERRRMRLGASRPEKIKVEVGLEVWSSSAVRSVVLSVHPCYIHTVCQLPSLYNEILNHPNTSDELRRSTESKLLRYKYQHMESAPAAGVDISLKQRLVSEVERLSGGAVLLDLPDELAWMFVIESKDAYDIGKLICLHPNTILMQFYLRMPEDYDFRTLRRFIGVFPTLPLTRLLQGYFNYMHLPIDTDDADDVDEFPEALPDSSDSFSAVLVRKGIFSLSPLIPCFTIRMLQLTFRTVFLPTASSPSSS
jgi:superkiller protein 3